MTSIPFLPSLGNLPVDRSESALDRRILGYLGQYHAIITPQSLENAISGLEEVSSSTGKSLARFLDVSALETIDELLNVLDGGAAQIFVSRLQLDQLAKAKTIDQGRIILNVDSATLEISQEIADITGNGSYGLNFYNARNADLIISWLSERGTDRPPVFVSFDDTSTKDVSAYAHLIDLDAIPIISEERLTLESTEDKIPISSLLRLKSDRSDGLFSTIVADERGIALGLVYSTLQSINESLKSGRGVYQSRKRGLWYKGESSGDIQELIRIQLDCDRDCLRYTVRQSGKGFCHLGTTTCFGPYTGISRLEKTLQARKASAPAGSYTARLFSSPDLLHAKIMEEAEELCEAKTTSSVAFEAADLIYFALTKCVSAGVDLADVERSLDAKSVKVKRRPGDAKDRWAKDLNQTSQGTKEDLSKKAEASPVQNQASSPNGRIHMKRIETKTVSSEALQLALRRPSQKSTDAIMGIVHPIIDAVRTEGDAALLKYTHQFDKAVSLKSPVLRAPFPQSLMNLPKETVEAIDTSFNNIRRFHEGQRELKPLIVETMPGVVCSRFSRPIERVGLYVPGGTAVLPSTALMLGVPAQVAGCKKIVIASPPRSDGSITPEIVYVAHKVGAESIVLAGGAQAIAALAYGTESVSKVDKILGPGNQFVTAGKMIVSNDTTACVSMDMPAGPSEVLVIADQTADPAFVASDLLSQAEHGVDSQVILIAVGLTEAQLAAIEDELHAQASALPRVDIVRGAIEHSVTLVVPDIKEALKLSNQYAPEHLILQVANAAKVVDMVENAGSVFIGPWTPESVGDYSAGVNHSLPTYGYARQYSGVNLASYVKHITSSNLTAEGLKNVSGAVMQLAKVEELEGHRRAVEIRLKKIYEAQLV